MGVTLMMFLFGKPGACRTFRQGNHGGSISSIRARFRQIHSSTEQASLPGSSAPRPGAAGTTAGRAP
jgi:hypothetical protein